jgi:hypothetical protein
VIIAAYLTTTTVGKAASDAAIAEVAQKVAGALAA